MKLKYSPTPLLISMLITFMAGACFAGLSDTLKSAGSQYADQGATAAGIPYTPSEAIAGIKEVLSLGTNSAVSELGKAGGFASNPATAFSLPDSLKGLTGGNSGLLSSLNLAAEAAVPSTGNIFLDAIQKLSISDPSALLTGGDDVITRFFESASRDHLKELIKPVVSTAVDSTEVGTYLNSMMTTQQATGLSGPSFDAYDFVADKTLDGMFMVMGMKEKDIRSTGGVGTTDLLKKLF